MSRALDKDTFALLKYDDPKSVYHSIVAALRTDTGEEALLEIEFLAKGHPLSPGCDVLIDGSNLAIPKSKLVQAFLVARLILFKFLKDCPPEKVDELRDATAVILLMDPEHLTAANTRKRLLQKLLSHKSVAPEAVLRSELRFVDTYLTSRLHRHTKSPTLWSHRRWILEQTESIRLRHDLLRDLSSVILVAAERHPRNYYAFLHMRWLLEAINDTPCLEQPTSQQPAPRHGQIISVVKDWCLRHPADTSGFSFLLHLITSSMDSESITKRLVERSRIFTEVTDLAVSFRWTHETVFAFLRTLVAEGSQQSDSVKFYEAIRSILAQHPQNQRIVEAARDWCTKYRQNIQQEDPSFSMQTGSQE